MREMVRLAEDGRHSVYLYRGNFVVIGKVVDIDELGLSTAVALDGAAIEVDPDLIDEANITYKRWKNAQGRPVEMEKQGAGQTTGAVHGESHQPGDELDQPPPGDAS